MKTLITACDTKPNNTDGDTVELANGLFPASITTPTPSISASTTPKKSPSSNSADSSSSGLSDGAKAGIGVGVGVAGLCILGAITWFLTRRQHPAVSTRSDLSQLDSRPIAPPSFQPETSQASYYSDHGYSVDPSTGSRNKMNPAELQGYNSVAELPSDQRA
ncbi:hypothetical protein NUU61_000949 [Penicillium alfredii]|uniref:Mid2 domain-containing protein n=1 Tax=Penicillium alfredii TaxID=1506179 RepID=A0A9W9GBV9_9EURO|nr:uncharacterized protein NUU61_000949 [Penicillium alfredii]KAJ5115190.1 hypothetical protein NUU61_000949 [Penicillium alfredii]